MLTNYIGYAYIAIVCIALVYLVLTKERPRWHYMAFLYFVAAGGVLLTTCAGQYLVGSDIHVEYYYAQLRGGAEVLPPAVPTPQGTSVLSYVSPSIWMYKVVYPLVLAMLPALLYLLHQKWLNPKRALIATFFFTAFPTLFMEIPSIPKQAIAEVFLAELLLTIYIFRDMPRYWKWAILGFAAAFIPLLHYSTAIVAILCLGVSLVIDLTVTRKLYKPILVSLAVMLAVGIPYFTAAEDGAVTRKVSHLYNGMAPVAMRIESLPEVETLPSEIAPKQPVREALGASTDKPFIDRYESMLRSGVGLDFLTVDAYGKTFRIIQWALVLLMLLGIWHFRRERLYWVMSGGFFLITLLCLVPGWASIMNSSRVLHLALMLLAPLVAVALKPKYMLILLIPYFLFTSGFAFEASQQKDVAVINIPYSIGLSNYRMDLGASQTDDDAAVRKFIIERELYPINVDIWGGYFLIESMGHHEDVVWGLPSRIVPLKGYAFIRSRNIRDGTFVIWNGIGLRRFVPIEDYGIDPNKNIVYQVGDARVVHIGDQSEQN